MKTVKVVRHKETKKYYFIPFVDSLKGEEIHEIDLYVAVGEALYNDIPSHMNLHSLEEVPEQFEVVEVKLQIAPKMTTTNNDTCIYWYVGKCFHNDQECADKECADFRERIE